MFRNGAAAGLSGLRLARMNRWRPKASPGRVQGPALKIIVDREREIKAFKPKPFWQIQLDAEYKSQPIAAWHKEDKFWEKQKADDVIKKTKNEKEAKVDRLERKQFNQMAPFPFDLTS